MCGALSAERLALSHAEACRRLPRCVQPRERESLPRTSQSQFTVKLTELEAAAPGLTTVIVNMPGLAMSLAGMMARN